MTGRSDYEVTLEGEEYINRLTEKLKNIPFDKAYSSTSDRTKKTIMPLAERNHLQIIQNENLCEMYFGIYDGWRWEDVNKINPEIDRLHQETNEIMCIPEQESTEQVTERMYNYMEKIAREDLGKIILVCSHGVAIESFLRKVTNIPFTSQREKYSQQNTSINVLEYDENEGFRILVLNDKSHLEDRER